MSRLLMACGVMATIGALVAGSISLGYAGQDGGDPGAPRTGGPPRTEASPGARPPAEDGKGGEAPSIAGRWEVLFMAGTVRGKREGYVEPNLLVPITERTVNLPVFSGNEGPSIVSTTTEGGRPSAGTLIRIPQHPIVFRGKLDYTAARKDQLGVIQVLTQDVGGKRDVSMQGIYRLAGDNLVICYNAERGPLPATFAADKDTEILLILRRERPVSQTNFTLPPGGIVLPATGPPPRRK